MPLLVIFFEASSLDYWDFEMHKETLTLSTTQKHTLHIRTFVISRKLEIKQTCVDSNFTFLCAWKERTGIPGRLSSPYVGLLNTCMHTFTPTHMHMPYPNTTAVLS